MKVAFCLAFPTLYINKHLIERVLSFTVVTVHDNFTNIIHVASYVASYGYLIYKLNLRSGLSIAIL